jgi:dynein heavy chain 1
MRFTLAMLLERSVDQILRFDGDESLTYDREQRQAYAQTIGSFFGWVDAFPAQIVILSSQVHWSQSVEQALDGSAKAAASLRTVLARTETTLDMLTERILHADIRPDARKKYEQVSNSRDHHGAVIASERLVEMHGSATDFSVTALFFSALTVFLADHGEGSPARRDPRAVGQRRVAR